MPSAPAKPDTLVRVQLDLPASIVDLYESQATSESSTESLIAARLQRCAPHTAQRGLYFDDAEREQLEQLLGGGIFRDAAEALRILHDRYSVTIGGANVRLDGPVYTWLKDRAEETSTDLREMIHKICLDALNDYVYGGH